jgi:hypothetical protein
LLVGPSSTSRMTIFQQCNTCLKESTIVVKDFSYSCLLIIRRHKIMNGKSLIVELCLYTQDLYSGNKISWKFSIIYENETFSTSQDYGSLTTETWWQKRAKRTKWNLTTEKSHKIFFHIYYTPESHSMYNEWLCP